MTFSLLASFSKGNKFRELLLLTLFSKGNKFHEVFLLTSFSKEVSREVFLLTLFSKEVSRDIFFAYFLFQKKVGQLLALFMVRRISTPLSARQ